MVLPAAERLQRAELVRIANLYFGGKITHIVAQMVRPVSAADGGRPVR